MTKKLIAGGVLLIALGAGLLFWQESSINSSRARMAAEATNTGTSAPRPSSTPRIPAHLVAAPAPKSLAPTLPPEQFFGSARDGYVKAKEIAPTLAQLPCYCDCDLHMGHKSLHTCFETDHAANCSVCLNEALLAYDLQKKQGLSVEEIRERIIAEYSPSY
jgi:hypothetical protein